MNTFEKQIMAGRLYAKTSVRDYKLAYARKGIDIMLKAAPHSYVSISFGKQSICVAHMVYKIAPGTPMYFLASDETWHMYDYRTIIDAFLNKWPINLNIVQTHRLFNAESWESSRDSGDRDLQEMCKRNEWEGWFWGLAKEESKARKRTCSRHCELHPSIYRYADGKLRCCPIQDWNIDDLSAYIDEYGIPVLNIYKKFGLQMRTTARITKNARNLGYGYLRETNSAGHRHLINEFPEISQ